jgi:hypothetical protein
MCEISGCPRTGCKNDVLSFLRKGGVLRAIRLVLWRLWLHKPIHPWRTVKCKDESVSMKETQISRKSDRSFLSDVFTREMIKFRVIGLHKTLIAISRGCWQRPRRISPVSCTSLVSQTKVIVFGSPQIACLTMNIDHCGLINVIFSIVCH